jgi:FAD:protein FMN transferase
MGMPITVEVLMDGARAGELVERVFDWFAEVDRTFSTYKPESVISRINRGKLAAGQAPELVRRVLESCERAKADTGGYFDAWHNGRLDPSGYVKGWAVWEAAELIRAGGAENYFVDAGGDIQALGVAEHGGAWRVGIRSPYKPEEVVKVLEVSDGAVATSGTYERGGHIYDPHTGEAARGVASVTVVGPRIDVADVWATAAFAAGERGAELVARAGLQCYVIGLDGRAQFTPGLPTARGSAHPRVPRTG